MLRSRAASVARHARTQSMATITPRAAVTQRIATTTSYPALTRRLVSSSSTPQATVQQDPPRKAPVIQTPLPSISSTVSRLLPSTVDPSTLPFPRPLAESLLGSVIEQVRNAADAKTVGDARAGWEKVDREARGKMQEEGHAATALTDLATVVVTASNDPRRHPIAFNLYRIAFGSDPASLPHIELDTSNLSFTKPDSEVSSSTSSSTSSPGTSATWGDWQSAYHWATLILQGRAPPPPGTALLLPGEQRSAQASQSSAAYRVFAHLATQGHARGLFGIGRHLLSTLERGVDPTSMGAMPSTGPARSRQETIAEVERLYRLAGEGGVEEAWFQLGAIYVEGKWVRKDEARARSFLEEGVSRGSPRACQALAQLLTREVQTPQAPSSLSMAAGSQVSEEEKVEKLQKALAMLERGAELGSAECAFAAGMRYLLQDAPPPPSPAGGQQQQAGLDPSTTMDMSLDPSQPSPVRQAAAQPTQDPQAHARAAHRTKWGVDPSDSRASGWLTRSAEGGNAVAMMNLARMHLEGRVPATTTEGEEEQGAGRKAQLLSAADLYSRILARAMGPEGQRAKALKEIQKKLAERAGGQGGAATASSPQGVPEPGLGGTGLDDLGARAEEGLRMVREEMEMIAGGGAGGERV